MRTNPVDPGSPLQKLTHSITPVVSCILHSTLQKVTYPLTLSLLFHHAYCILHMLSGFVPLDAG